MNPPSTLMTPAPSTSTAPLMLLKARFGHNLRSARVKAEISQEELGFRCGLHPTEVGLLERGRRAPGLGTTAKLAMGLGILPADLLDGIVWPSDEPEEDKPSTSNDPS